MYESNAVNIHKKIIIKNILNITVILHMICSLIPVVSQAGIEKSYNLNLKSNLLGRYEFELEVGETPRYKVIPTINSGYYHRNNLTLYSMLDNKSPSATYSAQTIQKVDINCLNDEINNIQAWENNVETLEGELSGLDARLESDRTVEYTERVITSDEIVNEWNNGIALGGQIIPCCICGDCRRKEDLLLFDNSKVDDYWEGLESRDDWADYGDTFRFNGRHTSEMKTENNGVSASFVIGKGTQIYDLGSWYQSSLRIGQARENSNYIIIESEVNAVINVNVSIRVEFDDDGSDLLVTGEPDIHLDNINESSIVLSKGTMNNVIRAGKRFDIIIEAAAGDTYYIFNPMGGMFVYGIYSKEIEKVYPWEIEDGSNVLYPDANVDVDDWHGSLGGYYAGSYVCNKQDSKICKIHMEYSRKGTGGFKVVSGKNSDDIVGLEIINSSYSSADPLRLYLEVNGETFDISPETPTGIHYKELKNTNSGTALVFEVDIEFSLDCYRCRVAAHKVGGTVVDLNGSDSGTAINVELLRSDYADNEEFCDAIFYEPDIWGIYFDGNNVHYISDIREHTKTVHKIAELVQDLQWRPGAERVIALSADNIPDEYKYLYYLYDNTMVEYNTEEYKQKYLDLYSSLLSQDAYIINVGSSESAPVMDKLLEEINCSNGIMSYKNGANSTTATIHNKHGTADEEYETYESSGLLFILSDIAQTNKAGTTVCKNYTTGDVEYDLIETDINSLLEDIASIVKAVVNKNKDKTESYILVGTDVVWETTWQDDEHDIPFNLGSPQHSNEQSNLVTLGTGSNTWSVNKIQMLNKIASELESTDVEKWRYTHNSEYYDNDLGKAGFSAQWLNKPVYKFDKVGLYRVNYKRKDNPLNTNNKQDKFTDYRKWSTNYD